jgi:hypothetical protein
MAMESYKKYIGDGVYIAIELGMIKLTTENEYGPTNTIHLEPEVFQNLLQHLEWVKEQIAILNLSSQKE